MKLVVAIILTGLLCGAYALTEPPLWFVLVTSVAFGVAVSRALFRRSV
jgi:uncharacterized protein (DUF983 family)